MESVTSFVFNEKPYMKIFFLHFPMLIVFWHFLVFGSLKKGQNKIIS